MPNEAIKILIVEDEIFLSDLYKLKFETEGFDVSVATNGEEGFNMAKSIKPDLIFLDLVMPVINGFECLKMIRADKETKSLLVVVLSNLGQQEEISKVMECGANAFLIKASLTPKQLVEKARELLLIQANTPEVPEAKVLEEENGENNLTTEYKDLKILFIEDNKEIIQMYRMQFEKSGYKIELAENGAWGLKLAKDKKFDVIIMDMVMPAMNGYEMLRVIKNDSENKETPVIVISNSAQDEEIEKTIATGANKYLIKSNIAPKELIEAIEEILPKE